MAGAIDNMGIVETDEADTLSPEEICFLEDIALADLNDPECRPDKLERAFSLGKLYADKMPLAMTGQFFRAATDILLNDAYSISTRISAARAADDWVERARDDDDDDEEEFKAERRVPLIPSFPAYFRGLLMVGRKSTSKAHVTVILENFDHASCINDDAAALILGELCSFIIATFIKFRDDEQICNLCQLMFEALGVTAESSQEMQEACKERILASGLMSVVANMLITNTVNKPALKDADKLIRCALGVLTTLLENFWPKPPSRLISETAYSVFRCLLATSEHDYDTLWSGCWMITQLIKGAGEIIIGQKYDDGRTGPQCILEVAAHSLKAKHNRSYSQTVIRLVSDASRMVKTLIEKLQATNKKLDLVFGKSLFILFEAVLSELKDASINRNDERSLLMIYARFMTTECEVVLDFLSSAPSGPAERSALAFVIADGLCRKKCERFAQDDRQVVKTALRKVLEYSRKHRDSELHKINLKGTTMGHSAKAIPLLSEIRRISFEEQTVQAATISGTV